MINICWNLSVSKETDKLLRLFLESHDIVRKSDFSHFIYDSVKTHMLEFPAEQIKATNISINELGLDAMVNEALT